MKTGKIFASAGCGKTTALLERLDSVFQGGAKPPQVLFSTFTRSGAYEARDRAVRRFNFNPDSFTFFRTLHSICYRAIVGPKIMSRNDYVYLGRELHVRFGSAGLGDELYERGKGDALLALYNLQRNIMDSDKVNEAGNLIPASYGVMVSQEEYDHFIKTYDQYRNERGLYDYTDLLEEILLESETGEFTGLPITHAFIDEAQDLTKLQYEVVKALCQQAESIWFAGDDDQCIFSYSGADPEILINLGAHDQVVLDRSYRLPVPVADYANEVAERIHVREKKHIRAHFEGKNQPERLKKSLNFIDEIVEGEPTTILCRNRVFFGYFEEYLQQKGKLYTFIKSTEAEEELDKNDLSQIRTAVLTWTRLINEPDAPVNLADLKMTLQYLPSVMMPQVKRKVLFGLHPSSTVNYRQLVANHGLVAQHGWRESLQNIPYEMKLYMEALERMGRIDKKPHIQIGTIHSFKGKEDDHVIVLPDMSWQTWKNYNDNPDSEHRVFFVAVTRCRERLTLLEPVTKYHYDW